MATTVWGLDIGNSAIKAIKILRTETECKIVDFDIVDLPDTGEEDKEAGLPKIEAAMQTLTTNHKFGNDPVYIAVAGGMVLHREFQLPPGSESKLEDLVTYEVKQQIPFPIEQVEWGYERFEDPNGVGISMFAVRKTDIADLVAMLKRMGLRVSGIVPASMALFNFIAYEFKPDNTCLILDAGSKSTDFVVMNKRQIFTRPIQIAGREITRVLENKFKVSFEKAEELKKNISQSPQAQKILGVIEPTLRQLGSEIQKTVGFYKSKAKGQRLNQCYLLGHTFRLPGMAETLQGLVREAPFALVEGLQKIKLDYTVNADVWNNEFPTMAVAIGLGLQGLGVSELKLNLLPNAMKTEQALAGWKVWSAAAAALIVATVGYSYVHASAAADRYSAVLEKAQGVEKEYKKFDKTEKDVVDSIPVRETMLKRLSRVGHDRGKVLDAFESVVNLQSNGKPALGVDSENKVLLTGLYVSRAPLTVNTTGTGSTDDPRSSVNREALGLPGTGAAATSSGGNASVYSHLKKGQDPATLPIELRPEPPLTVLLSGEYDNSGSKGNAPLSALATALKLPNVKDVRPEGKSDAVKRAETPMMFTYQGEKSPKPQTAGAETSYSTFNIVMRWDDAADPDNEPAEAAAPAADPKKPAAK